MNIIDLSIKRPVFITCIFLFSIVAGLLSYSKTKVDLFPDVTFPIVAVITQYDGASPEEVETLISKPIEEAVSSVSGIESLKSTSRDNVSTVMIEFKIGTDIKYAQQQVKDKLSSIKNQLPEDLLNDPVIWSLDPNAKAVASIAVSADINPTELYDIVDEQIKPIIEGISGVGKVSIIGGNKREIHVLLDRAKLNKSEISAGQVSDALTGLGNNVPAGSFVKNGQNSNVRTMGEFKSVEDIGEVPVKFYQNEVLMRVKDFGQVADTYKDITSIAYFNDSPGIIIEVYKTSDANTVEVADAVREFSKKANEMFASSAKNLKVTFTQDGARKIKNNLYDVQESIIIGLILTIIGVYLFLGSLRSTLITAIALPNSLICAFILIYTAGFTINLLTLLAMSLSVGLLIDDAIVVRENIFKHIEHGKTPMDAAREGTKEILLAVIATTFVILGVFLPIAFLSGIVGQFFKQFGFTVCFIMIISLLDALTMAPMLSAYFAGSSRSKRGIVSRLDGFMTSVSNKINNFMVSKYESILNFTIKHYFIVLLGAIAISFGGFYSLKFVAKTFIKQPDNGEFVVFIETKQGNEIFKTEALAKKVNQALRARSEVEFTVVTIGGDTTTDSNKANIFVKMIDKKLRTLSTNEFREQVRAMSSQFSDVVNFGITESDSVANGDSAKNTGAFTLNIIGTNSEVIKEVAMRVMEKLSVHPDLQDMDTSYRLGRPEVKIITNPSKAALYGVTTSEIGKEVKIAIDGKVSSTYKQNGKDYDVRVRLKEEQRNIIKDFANMYVPNLNQKLVKLSDIAEVKTGNGQSSIYRSDRVKYIAITASVNPKGKGGVNKAMLDAESIMKEEIKKYPEIRYQFDGDAKNFAELGVSIMTALGLAVILMYLVLASLYESFLQPFLIMTILPLALCGGFYALLITSESLDLFSMIGCVMLIGVSAKNSILLVDCINGLKKSGVDTITAIVQGGKLRIRPIVMTSIVLIMGMLPIAIGLNEASSQRISMGILIIGGLTSSTLLSLLVVPAIYAWTAKKPKKK